MKRKKELNNNQSIISIERIIPIDHLWKLARLWCARPCTWSTSSLLRLQSHSEVDAVNLWRIFMFRRSVKKSKGIWQWTLECERRTDSPLTYGEFTMHVNLYFFDYCLDDNIIYALILTRWIAIWRKPILDNWKLIKHPKQSSIVMWWNGWATQTMSKRPTRALNSVKKPITHESASRTLLCSTPRPILLTSYTK